MFGGGWKTTRIKCKRFAIDPELTFESVPTPQRGFPEAVARGFLAAN